MGKTEKPGEPEEPADPKPGDTGEQVARAPAPRLVVRVVPGKRSAENVEKVVQDFQARTGGRPMTRSTTDEYPADKAALLNA